MGALGGRGGRTAREEVQASLRSCGVLLPTQDSALRCPQPDAVCGFGVRFGQLQRREMSPATAGKGSVHKTLSPRRFLPICERLLGPRGGWLGAVLLGVALPCGRPDGRAASARSALGLGGTRRSFAVPAPRGGLEEPAAHRET